MKRSDLTPPATTSKPINSDNEPGSYRKHCAIESPSRPGRIIPWRPSKLATRLRHRLHNVRHLTIGDESDSSIRARGHCLPVDRSFLLRGDTEHDRHEL